MAADSVFTSAPGFLFNWLTIGIARAKWISGVNHQLNHKTGAVFAWFLAPFACYGLAKRLTAANAQLGSSQPASPLACFFLCGWPLIGSARRLKRGAEAYASALNVQARSAVAV
jgi:hypothetical protein